MTKEVKIVEILEDKSVKVAERHLVEINDEPVQAGELVQYVLSPTERELQAAKERLSDDDYALVEFMWVTQGAIEAQQKEKRLGKA